MHLEQITTRELIRRYHKQMKIIMLWHLINSMQTKLIIMLMDSVVLRSIPIMYNSKEVEKYILVKEY